MTMNRDYNKHKHRASEYITFDFDDVDTTQPTPDPQPVSGEGDKPSDFGFISFGSGSSGNCAYLGTFDAGILIDAGIDVDMVFGELQRNGVFPQAVKGIILTHDHQDHVRYVHAFLRKQKHLRVYCTPKCMTGLLRRHNISRRVKDFHEPIYKEIPFKLAGMELTAFEASHDGTDNMGFSIKMGDRTFVVATDMGMITDRAQHYMSQANHLMIESNYDRQMLDSGRYPEYLKARVRGEKGHLDNRVAAQFVASHYHEGLQHVFLCHLSNDNNRPEIARDTMVMALQDRGLTVGDGSNAPDQRGCDVQVYPLPRFQCSHWFVL